MTRASTWIARSPDGVTDFSCSTRSSFACRGAHLRDLVEEDRAVVGRLEFSRARGMGPVNAPFTCPKSSLSKQFAGMRSS